MGRSGDDFHSPAVQLSAMRRAASLAGLREVGEPVEDLDQTGTHFSRDGIDRIRALVEAGRIDAIAVYDVSRLGRNVLESLQFLKWINDRGVAIVSACEHIDTSTPAGEMMLVNMLAVAQYRAREIGRGWAAAIARRAERGQHHGRPLGYTRSEGRLVPDPLLGPVVAKAWADFAAGVKIGKICQEVADARGRPVHPANLKKIFRRPVYLGHVTTRTGEIITRDAHPPLVDERTFELAQLRLVRDAGLPPRVKEVTWSLVGLLYCPEGHRLQRRPTRYRGQPVDRLVCGCGPSRGVAGACRGVGTPRLAPVEAEVLRRVRIYIAFLRTDDAGRAAQLARRHTARADARLLRRRLTQVTDAIARLSKERALGELDDDEYHQPVAELREEAASLRLRLADLADADRQPDLHQAATAAQALLGTWPAMDHDQRNRVLRQLIRRVVVRPAAYWRQPEADRIEPIEWL
jgi:DNA invertase Pin-like site-specific DNA recombinase